MFDSKKILQDFPLLKQTGADGKRICYLDSGATSQKPESLKWEQTVEPPAMAAVVHGMWEGKPNFDVLWNAMSTWLYNNPLTDIDDLINDINAYIEWITSYNKRMN